MNGPQASLSFLQPAHPLHPRFHLGFLTTDPPPGTGILCVSLLLPRAGGAESGPISLQPALALPPLPCRLRWGSNGARRRIPASFGSPGGAATETHKVAPSASRRRRPPLPPTLQPPQRPRNFPLPEAANPSATPGHAGRAGGREVPGGEELAGRRQELSGAVVLKAGGPERRRGPPQARAPRAGGPPSPVRLASPL